MMHDLQQRKGETIVEIDAGIIDVPISERISHLHFIEVVEEEVNSNMTERALKSNHESSILVSQKPCQDPHKFLLQLLRDKGYELDEKSILSLPSDFFLEVTAKRIADYDNDVIHAIRQGDIAMLRELLHQGKSMQCCNKFGESVLHMACRRGFSHVVRFLLDEAKVSLRVKDDYGRTPFHDACWLPKANFDLISILLDHDPDLLLVKDIRGFTPIAYARRNDWDEWSEFLDRMGSRITLKTFGSKDTPSSNIVATRVTV